MSPPVFVQVGDAIVAAPRSNNKGMPLCYPIPENVNGGTSTAAGPPPPPPYYQVYEGHTSSTTYLAVEHSHVFSDKTIRLGFMRKVFTILSVQVVVTFSLVALFAFVPAVNEFLQREKYKEGIDIVSYVAGGFLILAFICILLIAMQPKWMNKTPTNYIFLAFVTICTAISLAIITAFIPSKLGVFYTTGMTLSVVTTLTLFTFQSTKELTYWTGFFLAVGGVGIIGVVMYFAGPLKSQERQDSIILAGILTVFFALFWIYLVDKMMLNGGKLSKSPDEFILAAMYLYLGTVLMFLILLALLVGGARFRFCCWWYRTERRDSQNTTV